MNSWYHAQSAARKWGGTAVDYLPIEEFIDSSKQVIGDSAIHVPVRLVAERHILEDLGWLPSPADYIEGMPVKGWMSGAKKREMNLSELLGGK